MPRPGRNGFLLAMVGVVVAAWLFPGLGVDGGPLPVDALATVGVFLIFLLQGFSLPFEELRRGASHWRLHLCVQGTVFVFFPALTAGILFLAGDLFTRPEIGMGFLYLSFLPVTIASAVTLTALARGNVTGALFNATVSNVAGVFLVPLLCLLAFGFGSGGESFRTGPLLLGISLKIILPLFIGQGLRLAFRSAAEKRHGAIRSFNNSVILFIVWTAFCESFTSEVWSSLPRGELLAVLVVTLLLLIVSSVFAWNLPRLFGLDRPSRIAALLCGSQKTLGAGLPLSLMIFGAVDRPLELSLLILPLLLYHPAQLILGGWLAPRLAAGLDHAESAGR